MIDIYIVSQLQICFRYHIHPCGDSPHRKEGSEGERCEDCPHEEEEEEKDKEENKEKEQETLL